MKSKSKINPDIFLDAGEYIAERLASQFYFTCTIISQVGGKSSTKKFYQNLFGIGYGVSFSKMWEDIYGMPPTDFEVTELRLMALALAHEIAICKKQKKSYRK